MEQGEGLFHDVAELAPTLMSGEPLREMTGVILRLLSSRRTALDSCALSPSSAAGRSSSPAALSSASRMRCSWSKTPAPCHRSSRRQQVCPEPKPSSRGRSCRAMPLWSTYRTPCRHSRSSTGRGPGAFSGQCGGSGSISIHETSCTTHGRIPTPSRTAEPLHRHARPGHLNKIVLRARGAGRHLGEGQTRTGAWRRTFR